jgi:hypothetical protein
MSSVLTHFHRVRQGLFSTTNQKPHREPAEFRGLPGAESETVGKLGLVYPDSEKIRWPPYANHLIYDSLRA